MGRLQGRHAALTRPQRGKPIAALVTHDLTDPWVSTETLNNGLLPARCRGRVLVQEVSACAQLELVYFDSKGEQHAGLNQASLPLCRAPAATTEVLQSTELRTRRAPYNQVRLLTSNLGTSPTAVLQETEVPRPPVGI